MHKISTKQSHEAAVEGVTTGLINLNESVTWRAVHLFKIRLFTSKITGMIVPAYFCDEMQNGDFALFKHEHYFNVVDDSTLMKDIVKFKSPYNLIGKIFNKIYLTNYLKSLLIKRNICIKFYAESEEWKNILINV